MNKGYCFVEFKDASKTMDVVNGLNGMEGLGEQPLTVRIANPRNEQQAARMVEVAERKGEDANALLASMGSEVPAASVAFIVDLYIPHDSQDSAMATAHSVMQQQSTRRGSVVFSQLSDKDIIDEVPKKWLSPNGRTSPLATTGSLCERVKWCMRMAVRKYR